MKQEDLSALMTAANANPHDVHAQIAAAYGCDRHGSEDDAIRYYDVAWAVGVPPEERQRFIVGYGSTLRNVGRTNESIAIYRQGIADYPGYAPYHAFLALSLHDQGSHTEGLAAALSALLEAGADDLDGYDRALRFYVDDLTT